MISENNDVNEEAGGGCREGEKEQVRWSLFGVQCAAGCETIGWVKGSAVTEGSKSNAIQAAVFPAQLPCTATRPGSFLRLTHQTCHAALLMT